MHELSRRTIGLTVIGFLAVAFLTYGMSLGNEFVNFDDGLLIYQNPISQGLNFQNLKLAFTSYDPELYIPLTFVSYQLNYVLGGLNPVGYHLVNVLLHAFNALLFAGISLLLTRRRIAALIAGLLFLVHPLHTEAVAWAAARKDLLSSFFFLLSLGSFLFYREGSRKWYLASVVFFLCALLSKVSAIVLPAVIVLIDWAHGRSILKKKAIAEMIPYGVLCVVFAIVAIGGKIGSGSLMVEKILIGCKATVFYLTKLVVPTGLSAMYPYTQAISLQTPDLLASFFIVITITAACVVLLKRSRVPLAAWLTFGLLIFPSFGNIAKGQEHFRDIYFGSDRYAYLASLAILLCIGLGFDEARKRWGKIIDGLVGVVVALFAVLAFYQSLTWHDTERVFTNVLRHYPNSQLAHNYVGSYRFERGDLEGALEEYEKSLAVRPNDLGFFNTGVVLEKQGKIGEAMEAYRGAIAINPIAIDARINLGVILLDAGQYGEAASLFQGAIDVSPIYAGARDVKSLMILAYFNLGAANENLGKREEAIAAYRKVLELDPSDVETAEKIRTLSAPR